MKFPSIAKVFVLCSHQRKLLYFMHNKMQKKVPSFFRYMNDNIKPWIFCEGEATQGNAGTGATCHWRK